MPNLSTNPREAIHDALPLLRYTAAVLEVLHNGLTDVYTETHLLVWRDISQHILAETIAQLRQTIAALRDSAANTEGTA